MTQTHTSSTQANDVQAPEAEARRNSKLYVGGDVEHGKGVVICEMLEAQHIPLNLDTVEEEQTRRG